MSVRGTYCAIGLVLATVLVVGFLSAAASVLPTDMKIEKVIENTADLGNLVQSPTGELWLLERTTGVVKVLVGGRQVATTSVSVTSTCQAGLEDAAFAPDYAQSGLAFVYFVDSSNHAVVHQLHRGPGAVLTVGANILDAGAVADDCRPGGGLMVGKDGKLYVSVGDLGIPSDAQSDASLLGKVLRLNLDGSIPADNPDPTSRVWAKGFRNGKGMAYNPDSARAGGTFYLADIGSSSGTTADDELNALLAGGNYGWNLGSGAYPGYEQPLVSYAAASLVNPEGAAALHHSRLGASHSNSLIYACPTNDAGNKGTVKELPLSGVDFDVAGTAKTLFDPVGDLDGTPDAACPEKVNAVTMAGDGALYVGNTGANKGIWRIWRDHPGPREVSFPGSPFQLMVEKSGASSLKVYWEKLGSLDAHRAKRYAAGQRAQAYRIFEGTLPLDNDADYDHTAVLSTDGDGSGEALGRVHATITPGAGNRYYLVQAQGDNLEGSLGAASTGAERPLPGTKDYCDTIGWGRGNELNRCFRDFRKPDGTPLKLKDYNPKSETYGRYVSLADFRGKVIRVDISALNCSWCKNQAYCFNDDENKSLGRDSMFVTIMMNTYNLWDAIPSESQCATGISNWANTYNDHGPILCDVDQDGTSGADAAHQITTGTCGTPENFYIDQGMVHYKYVCGAEDYHLPPLGYCDDTIFNSLLPELNAETCE